MTIRTLLAAAMCALAAGATAHARDLTIATWPEVAEAQKEAFPQPVHVVTWDASLPTLRTKADAWDVVLVTGAILQAGCAEGLLAKLDWQAIGGRDHYQPQAVSDCGVGAFTRHFALAWDRDKFQGTPSWPDFWDVAKFPGKRGLHRGARMNLEIALLADGTAASDVYRILRTDDGVDRAFRKLEQIKPYLVWWRTPDDAERLIASGGVLLECAPIDRIAGAPANHHFGSQPAGGLYQVASWAIPKSSPDQAGAAKLLASMADPAEQARFTAATGLGTLAKGVTDGLTPEQAAASPSNPALLGTALQIDDAFWRDNADRLDERFDAWLAH